MPFLQHFLENLAPHTGMTEREFDDYLYTRSMVIEPRGAKQPVKNVSVKLFSREYKICKIVTTLSFSN